MEANLPSSRNEAEAGVAGGTGHSDKSSSEGPTPSSTPSIKVEPVDSDFAPFTEDVSQEQPEDYDDIGEFFFESDHLALRGNADYRNVLKTLAVLEAQRVQVIRDIEQLIQVREQALSDPIRFVERLQKKEDVGIPLPQTVPQIPNIDWSQYSLSNTAFGFEGKRQFTRQTAKTEPKPSAPQTSTQSSGVLIRGRVFSENKPATFNQLWTAEEQKRLEDCLLKFPPEEVESRRWEKIAQALGNRTPTQVASRVQKYFIKLAKAGLPVPGRIPNVSAPRRIGGTGTRRGHQYHHRSNVMFSHSTFFASHRPPVYMVEGEEENSTSTWSFLESEASSTNDKGEEAVSEDDSLDASAKETPEYKELRALKRARQERLSKAGLAQHVGFRCDRCDRDPILGTRWHCTDCPPGRSVDFCSDCVDCMHEFGNHRDDHHLEPVRTAQDCSTFHDRDYMSFAGADYNYLDPNYLPATG